EQRGQAIPARLSDDRLVRHGDFLNHLSRLVPRPRGSHSLQDQDLLRFTENVRVHIADIFRRRDIGSGLQAIAVRLAGGSRHAERDGHGVCVESQQRREPRRERQPVCCRLPRDVRDRPEAQLVGTSRPWQGAGQPPRAFEGRYLMLMIGRLAVISLGLFSASVPSTVALRRHYGRRPAARFAIGSVLAIVAQQALVGVAASRRNARLTAVDAMTLSRGVAAAVLVGLLVSGLRHRSGLAGWLGWGSVVYGSIVCDWLDGPVARRL